MPADLDGMPGMWRVFESLDFVGLISVAITVLVMVGKLISKLTRLDETMGHFVETNHEDHEEIKVRLRGHSAQVDEHSERITRVETQMEDVRR